MRSLREVFLQAILLFRRGDLYREFAVDGHEKLVVLFDLLLRLLRRNDYRRSVSGRMLQVTRQWNRRHQENAGGESPGGHSHPGMKTPGAARRGAYTETVRGARLAPCQRNPVEALDRHAEPFYFRAALIA